ncbi:site-specific integrase, partial [Bifidobacterium pullorum]|uniref:site-specific integrase n=1 Tax=Bifidobacterium pullorum TaxID=78448 RepID=UPI0024325D0A
MESRFTLVFDQFLAHIGIERGLASSTVDAYASDLRRYVEWLESRGVRAPEDIVRRDVEEYVAALDAAGESARSKARRLASIHAFHRFALAQHAVSDDVSAAVKAPKGASVLPDVLTVDEVARLL